MSTFFTVIKENAKKERLIREYFNKIEENFKQKVEDNTNSIISFRRVPTGTLSRIYEIFTDKEFSFDITFHYDKGYSNKPLNTPPVYKISVDSINTNPLGKHKLTYFIRAVNQELDIDKILRDVEKVYTDEQNKDYSTVNTILENIMVGLQSENVNGIRKVKVLPVTDYNNNKYIQTHTVQFQLDKFKHSVSILIQHHPFEPYRVIGVTLHSDNEQLVYSMIDPLIGVDNCEEFKVRFRDLIKTYTSVFNNFGKRKLVLGLVELRKELKSLNVSLDLAIERLLTQPSSSFENVSNFSNISIQRSGINIVDISLHADLSRDSVSNLEILYRVYQGQTSYTHKEEVVINPDTRFQDNIFDILYVCGIDF